MSKFLKFLPLGLALISIGYGAEQDSTKPKIDQGYGVSKDQMASGYASPARYDVTGDWDFYIQGSFIFWQPVERGLEVALVTPSEETPWSHYGKIKNLNFKFKPGFKVALGLAFDKHDDWLMATEYTRLVCKEFKTVNITDSSYYIYPSWDYYANVNYAYAKWKLNYNIIDSNFSRPYYLGSKLILRPNGGLRGGWIHQKYSAIYDSDAYYATYPTAKQRTWLIGPRVGFDADWMLGCGFRLFGDAFGSLLYQHFNTKFFDTSLYDEEAATYYKYKNKVGYVTPNAELGIGFGWGSYFWDHGCHYDLKIGYDFQIYWNQNQMRALKDQVYDGDELGVDGNLMFNGLTVTMRFDF